jgi:two-component system, sensor histidine kinase and response regulator
MTVGLVGQAIVATTVRTFFEIRRHNKSSTRSSWSASGRFWASPHPRFVLPEEIHPKLSIYAVMPLTLVVSGPVSTA